LKNSYLRSTRRLGDCLARENLKNPQIDALSFVIPALILLHFWLPAPGSDVPPAIHVPGCRSIFLR
jgi:hypothetical protein